jgi:regulator of replication initiation timing
MSDADPSIEELVAHLKNLTTEQTKLIEENARLREEIVSMLNGVADPNFKTKRAKRLRKLPKSP